MKQLVLVESGADASVPQLLRALGVAFTTSRVEQIANRSSRRMTGALLMSEEQLVRVARAADDVHMAIRNAFVGYSRVLIWPFSSTSDGLRVLGALGGCRPETAAIASAGDVHVVGPSAMCGPFTNLTIPFAGRDARPLHIGEPSCACDWFATIGDAGMFGRFATPEMEIFVNATTAVFEVGLEFRKNLQATECFAGLVPLLWFLERAEIPIPRCPNRWANWIIDDPTLRRHYGFVCPAELASTMTQKGAAVTIGFIPWNYQRTSAEVVGQFREAWPHAAVCVHGCNHTLAEFSTTSCEAYRLGALAVQRMRQLESRTGLQFENVMVFPQGKFSSSAMSALRHLDLVGVVNTELADSETGRGVSGAELLQPAITSYSGLPLFLRRPAEESLCNFALDMQLGKPCLIVTHHGYFRNGLEPMLERIEALNRLAPGLGWTSLANGISETASIQQAIDGGLEIRLFSPRSRLRLPLTSARISFTKHEPLADATASVVVNGRALPFQALKGDVSFVTTDASGVAKIQVTPCGVPHYVASKPRVRDRAKIAARRYLSEIRDNYVQRSGALKTGVAIVRKIIGAHA